MHIVRIVARDALSFTKIPVFVLTGGRFRTDWKSCTILTETATLSVTVALHSPQLEIPILRARP